MLPQSGESRTIQTRKRGFEQSTTEDENMIAKLLGSIAGFATLLYSLYLIVFGWTQISPIGKFIFGLLGLGVVVFLGFLGFFLLQGFWEKIWRWLRSR